MPDEPQNPTLTENPSPASPQEPIEQGTENTGISEPAEALPEALESSPSDFSAKSTNIPPSDSVPSEPEKTQENQDSSDAEALADREMNLLSSQFLNQIKLQNPKRLKHQ